MTGIWKFGSLLRAIGINPDYANLPMKAMSAWHDWSGVALAVLVLVHLILNWNWIVCTTKSFFKKEENNEREI